MPISAEYDEQADALYVRFDTHERERTLELDDSTYVDVDAGGHPVGFEFLYPSIGVDVAATARRFSLDRYLPEIIAAITEAGAPVPPLTMTGGQLIGSTTLTGYVIEGTTPAACCVNETVSSASVQAQEPVFAGSH
jgi:uncharacterized protein YuzE